MIPAARLIKIGAISAGALLVTAGALWGYSAYSTRRGALDTEILRYRADLDNKNSDLAEQSRLKKRLAELAVGSLGENEETVSASIRTALNEIAAECGLSNTSVTTREPDAVKNPAAKAGAVEFSGSLPREAGKGKLKDLSDFHTMTASVTGVGTLDQVMQALVTIQSQPWARRVDSVALRPVGTATDRSRMEITLRLTTVFLPGVKPARQLEATWTKPDSEALSAVRYLVAKNAFREPPPAPAVAAAPTRPAPPLVVGAPYADWRVTAVVRGLAGPELWLLNEKTRENLILAIGQAVMDAVFVGATGEVARIKIGEQEFDVALAQTLQDRKVVSR